MVTFNGGSVVIMYDDVWGDDSEGLHCLVHVSAVECSVALLGVCALFYEHCCCPYTSQEFCS